MALSLPDPQPQLWKILSPHQEAMVEACKTGQLAQLQRLFEEHHVKQGHEIIWYNDTKGEGAPTTATLFEAAISHGQQSNVRCLRSIYPDFDFREPCFGFDDHMTSMLSLAIEEGPQNAPFILFLLDHGAMSLDNGSYTYHLGCELLPAITNDQPIGVIKRMVPLTACLSFPKMTAINRKRTDALEAFLDEEQKRIRGTQSSEDLESTLQSVKSTGDKELIAVVERHIHKVEQQAAKDAQKNSRSTKKWWQFGMGKKATENTAPTDSSSPTRSEGSSWWPSLSKT
ncbi:uncharacterized protein A1O5_02161 [Cladophialophora psammophila CBS 110553]|uniref:Uncharacterized protein n=1 Tax=Cladophialophora psammophila CBS 110553 TaxID=1182543 RepID=W9XDR4_9EURO|nr:uncharacterized protein A1O5_02161 [Cladophialophora psammophila CBS 110553]EXJ75465.1 hypothetical protein A1O5_02161 [Cladophialophora psammophila CBS 110553]